MLNATIGVHDRMSLLLRLEKEYRQNHCYEKTHNKTVFICPNLSKFCLYMTWPLYIWYKKMLSLRYQTMWSYRSRVPGAWAGNVYCWDDSVYVTVTRCHCVCGMHFYRHHLTSEICQPEHSGLPQGAVVHVPLADYHCKPSCHDANLFVNGGTKYCRYGS